MKILCPTDFSEHAGLALKEAIHIANKTMSEIVVLSTFTVPTSSTSFVSLDEVIINNTQEDLLKIKKEVIGDLAPGVKLSTDIAQGIPSRTIVGYARDHHFDLIIMGTQGSTNMSNILVGSTTKAVFKKSSIPVLAIPVERNHEGIGTNFILALDGEPIESKKTLEIILPLYKVYDAELSVYHVSKEDNLMPIDPIVEEYLPNILEEIIIEKGKKTVDSIKKYVVDHDVGLLIMIRRKKSWWEKLFIKGYTEEEFFRTRIPMLMLPDQPVD